MDPLVDRFQAARSDPTRVVLEGFHALKHAARFGAEIEAVALREDGAAERLADEIAPDAAEALRGATVLGPADFDRLTSRPHPTGVAALARRPAVTAAAILADPSPAPVVLLEDPRRPENLGAVVRVAAAAGAAGVLSLGGIDPWHPAAVRGAAGLQFALPVARVDAAAALLPAGRPLVALDPAGEPLATLPPRALLAFGTERRGLSQELRAAADRRLAIPMRPGVSSLNLATAVAVVLYAGRGLGG